MPNMSSVPLREIVIDRVAEFVVNGAVEKDAETMARDVAQKGLNSHNGHHCKKDDDDNGHHCKKDDDGMASACHPGINKKEKNIETDDGVPKKTAVDIIDDELSLNLKELLNFNKRRSVDTSTTVGTGTTALRVPVRSSVDATTDLHEQEVQDEQEQEPMPYSMSSRRSTSLRSLVASTSLRDHLDTTCTRRRSTSMRSLDLESDTWGGEGRLRSRRWSLAQQGRQPSLRRRHSICYSLPSCSATDESSEHNPASIDRRASMSCADARSQSASLSSIITECHPLSMGIGDFSDDDDDDESDLSIGSSQRHH